MTFETRDDSLGSRITIGTLRMTDRVFWATSGETLMKSERFLGKS
jgi:hypothetical protein